MSLLEITGLTVALPQGGDRAHAVEDVSLALQKGEILCIVGESGSGKSVSTSAVMGLLPSSLPVRAGRILFEGKDLLTLKPDELRELRGSRIGMIFQEPMTALNPLMRVGDQIAEVMEVHGRRLDNRVAELIEAVHLPEPLRIARSFPHQLSGGQRQRVMIAMALALEPALLIADEPTTALDVTTQMQILRLVRELQQRRGMGVLFITHDFGVVAEIADRVAVMQEGRIVESGSVAQVLNAPVHPYTRKLIAAVPRFSGGRSGQRGSVAQGEVLITAEGVRKSYNTGGLFHRRTTTAVDDASFEIRRGETLGLVGESGSGKSTLARTIVRLIKPDGGAIRFDGQDLSELSRSGWKPYRRRIQMVFQDPFASLNPRRKVGEIIAEGPIAHGVPSAQARAEALELLELVRLDRSAAGRFPHEFSGGQRQRIGIARALAMKPELLVADEPVSALDVSVQAQVLELLRELRRELNLSMLFITHDLRVAAEICDRVAVMRGGVIVEHGTTVDVFSAPKHDYTRQLLDSIPGRHWSLPEFAAEPAA